MRKYIFAGDEALPQGRAMPPIRSAGRREDLPYRDGSEFHAKVATVRADCAIDFIHKAF